MVCPTCSSPYQPGDRFCGSCGERLAESASAPAARPANPWEAAAPAGPPVPSIPSFEGGGATIATPAGAAFGQSPYGSPPTPPAMPIGGVAGAGVCPTCSAPVEPSDVSCLVCGAELKPGVGAPAGGSPFDAPGGSPFGAPPQPGPFGGGQEPYGSPFGAPAGAGSPFGSSGEPGGRPFGGAPPAPSSPFSSASEPAAGPFGGGSSPFAASGEPGGYDAPPSPLTGPVPGAAPSPFGEPPAASPFGGQGALSPQSPPYGTPRPSAFPEPGESRGSSSVCPLHGVMKDPSWTRCPDCIREGRDGRLIPASSAGTIDMSSAPPPPPAPAPPPPAPVVEQQSYAPPPRPVYPPAPEPPSFSSAPATPPPPAFTPAPPVGAASNTGADEGRPISSVNQTFVIRRKPRSLAYLIEKEGEQVGRVFQLERDVTDLGRDPRNHIVVSDVLVSGFHARVERTGDGFTITDRGSTNGSRLNGDPLTGSRPLVENDELGVGNTTLVLKVVQ